MELSKVGWHTSVKELLNTSEDFLRRHSVYQVFVGSPRTLAVPDFTDIGILKKRYPWLQIVVHCPYVVSLCRSSGDESYIRTLSYMIAVAKELDKIGVEYLVTHIGSRKEDMDVKESALNLWGFCTRFLFSTEGCKIKLCLENDSGSKKGTKMGHLRVLKLVIDKCNSERIRMTFDVEHAYAAGFDVENKEEILKYKDYIEVVHWNSVPQNVIMGGHLDRHSTTSFYESKANPLPSYEALYDGRRPFIFEVDSPVYVKSNLEWLRENDNGRA